MIKKEQWEMPNLAQELRENELAVETPTVFELMDRFYQLYLAMSRDPCLDDLAGEVAELIIELDERRDIAMLVAAEEEGELKSKALH